MNLRTRFMVFWNYETQTLEFQRIISVLCLLIVGPVFLAYWNLHIPLPGKAIAAVGVGAALMTVLGEMKPAEKAGWIFLLSAFVWLEFVAIRTDRESAEAAASAAQREQAKHFQEVLDANSRSLTMTLDNFQRVNQQEQRTFSTAHELLNAMTGGKTFPEALLVWRYGKLSIVADGKDPLTDVTVSVLPHTQRIAGHPEKIGDMLAEIQTTFIPMIHGNQAYITTLPITPEGNYDVFVIQIIARNGSWSESLKFHRNDAGTLEEETEISDSTGKIIQPFTSEWAKKGGKME